MSLTRGSAQHIGSRRSQQDFFGFKDIEQGVLAVVCDGMGGMRHGDTAARIACATFLEAYSSKTKRETIPEALLRSAREANHQVVHAARGFDALEGMGTTLAAVAVIESDLFYISVGDSGIFLASRKKIRQLNRHHVFGNYLDEAAERGVLTKQAAREHPERESLTSFIGAEKLEEIDYNTKPIALASHDSVLVASDGLFKTLSPDEMRRAMAGTAQEWAERLVAATLAKGSQHQDNVTALIIGPS